MNMFIFSLAARLPGGGGCPGAYFPVSTPCASGENARLPIPCRAHAGKTAASGLRHSMEYCGWLAEKGTSPPAGGNRRCRVDLLRRPLAESDGAHLARPYGTIERDHRLFERSLLVVAMALVEIDGVDVAAAPAIGSTAFRSARRKDHDPARRPPENTAWSRSEYRSRG